MQHSHEVMWTSFLNLNQSLKLGLYCFYTTCQHWWCFCRIQYGLFFSAFWYIVFCLYTRFAILDVEKDHCLLWSYYSICPKPFVLLPLNVPILDVLFTIPWAVQIRTDVHLFIQIVFTSPLIDEIKNWICISDVSCLLLLLVLWGWVM